MYQVLGSVGSVLLGLTRDEVQIRRGCPQGPGGEVRHPVRRGSFPHRRPGPSPIVMWTSFPRGLLRHSHGTFLLSTERPMGPSFLSSPPLSESPSSSRSRVLVPLRTTLPRLTLNSDPVRLGPTYWVSQITGETRDRRERHFPITKVRVPQQQFPFFWRCLGVPTERSWYDLPRGG